MKTKLSLSTLSALGVGLFTPLSAFAQDVAEHAEEPSLLFQAGDILIYIILAINILLSIKLIKTFGKGVLNIAFISFGFGMVFFTLSKLFTFFQDMGVFNLSDVTLHVWWHIIFYFAMLSIIWGGYRLKKIVDTGSGSGWGRQDMMFYGLLLLLTFVIYIVAAPLESVLSPMLIGSIVDTMGLHHFGSFILAVFAGWYLFYIKGHWGILGVSITFIVGFIILVGIQHLWECLTESWKVIILEDSIIEQVEQFIVLPGIILYGAGLWKMIKAVKV